MPTDGRSFERWCLVSGGSGGIGAAVCEQLTKREIGPIVGYHRARDEAQRIAERCGGLALRLDLSDAQSVADVAQQLTGLPRVSGVVLAGSPPPELTPFGQLTASQMLMQWQVNVLGPQQLLAQLVRGCFRRHKAGVVVGVLSRAMGGENAHAAPNMAAYVIGKHGLAGVLLALAAEYPWLRVRSVRPGYTETDMLRAFDERFLQLERAKAAFQTPEAVATLILQEAFEA